MRGQRTYRSITIENEELEFSGEFTDLHTISYQEILKSNGYGIEATRKAIEIVHDIRHAEVEVDKDNAHPLVGRGVEEHPFGI